MKVIHFIPSLDRRTGGTAFYIQALAAELGKHTELYIVTKRTDNPLEITNAKVIYIDLSLKKIKSIKRNFQQIIDQVKPDIIHINVIWMLQCYIVHSIARANKIKVVLSPHGMTEPWILNRHRIKKKLALFLYQKKSLKTADRIHVTAQSEKDNFLKLEYNSNVKMIPNGIRLEEFDIKENWSKKKKILFLSRIHEKKGVEFLLEAIYEIRGAINEYEVIIAGEGEDVYVNALNKFVADKGMTNIIKFIGGVYGVEKFKLYREADLFVLPTYSENFGIVIAEAMASGTPVITTNGTPWHELNTLNCGWCIDVGVDALQDTLTEFFAKSEKELEIMGRNARKLIQSKYSSSIVSEKMCDLYKELL